MAQEVTDKVLLVDDDRNLLDSFKRHFRKRLNLVTSNSPADGLQALLDDGPFAVVISDLRMPNMDGVEFLSRVRSKSPDTVRFMLTGNASLDVAIDAVNQGNIYRFLNKPIDTDTFYRAIMDGIQQHRLITTERLLLNKTLKGVVDLLSDLLGLIHTELFSQSSRIKQQVRNMVQHLGLEDGWNYELAAMLSQLGYATFPKELLEKLIKQQPMSPEELDLVARHPRIGGRLISHIPRLETVAAIIENQNAPVQQIEIKPKLPPEEKAILGGQILKVALAFTQLLNTGLGQAEAISTLHDRPEEYDPALVQALALGDAKDTKIEQLSLPLEKLQCGMILDQAIYTAAGSKLVAKGQEINDIVRTRLLVAGKSGIISGTIKVVRITGPSAQPDEACHDSGLRGSGRLR